MSTTTLLLLAALVGLALWLFVRRACREIGPVREPYANPPPQDR